MFFLSFDYIMNNVYKYWFKWYEVIKFIFKLNL